MKNRRLIALLLFVVTLLVVGGVIGWVVADTQYGSVNLDFGKSVTLSNEGRYDVSIERVVPEKGNQATASTNAKIRLGTGNHTSADLQITEDEAYRCFRNPEQQNVIQVNLKAYGYAFEGLMLYMNCSTGQTWATFDKWQNWQVVGP